MCAVSDGWYTHRCTGVCVVRGLFGSGSSWLVCWCFACATILVVRGDEKASVVFCVQHLLLNTSSTYATRLNPKSAQKAVPYKTVITGSDPNRGMAGH